MVLSFGLFMISGDFTVQHGKVKSEGLPFPNSIKTVNVMICILTAKSLKRVADLKNIEIGFMLREFRIETTKQKIQTCLLTGPHLTSFVRFSDFVELRTIAVLFNITGQIKEN